MKKIFTIFFVFCPLLVNAKDEVIKTVGGPLKIVEKAAKLRGSNIIFNGKYVLPEDVLSIEFVKKYSIEKTSVILVSLADGANGNCPVEYFFITVISKDSISISPSILCHAEADLKTHQQNSKIIGVIPKLEMKGDDRYVFENGVLTENGRVMRN